MTAPWIATWIKPRTTPAETAFSYHDTRHEAEVFATGLAATGIRQVVIYLGPVGDAVTQAEVAQAAGNEGGRS